MEYLFLTRGLPGCGKSTFLKQNLPEAIFSSVISSDSLRLLFNSVKHTPEGTCKIDNSDDKKVWKLLFELVESRMAKGDTIIVDATHYSHNLIKSYKTFCQKYNYEIILLDFTNGDIQKHRELSIKRNKERSSFKIVPEEVIERMATVMEQENEEILKKYKVINANDVNGEFTTYFQPFNYDKYSKIVFFGDIHGCLDPLKEYFDKNPYQEDFCYIFTGDYIDRGIQNKELLEYIMPLADKRNVSFLEGNHERWLRYYTKGELSNIRSKEFKENTLEQIKDVSIDDIRHFVKKLKTFLYFKYGDNEFVVSHGGIPKIPNIFDNREEYIKGVGRYEDSETVDSAFNNYYSRKVFSVHAHRNVHRVDMQNTEKTFNLEGRVEFGGELRILEVDRFGVFNKIKNSIYRDLESDKEIIKSLKKSDLIKEKHLNNNISSFNFTKECFFTKDWNDLNVKARGLFIDMDAEKIVARSYNKFFNLNENEETSEKNLLKKLVFPCYMYKKENGYLGLLSWNFKTNDFFIASKSTNQGDFAENLKRILMDKYKINENKELIYYLQTSNVTMIFEVIDPVFDPHIIKYNEEEVILLDIVSNNFKPEFLPYNYGSNNLQLAAKLFGFPCKILMNTVSSFEELMEVKNHYDLAHIEGFVVEDQTGYRFKVKTKFYSFWKIVRNKFNEQLPAALLPYQKDFPTSFDLVKNYPVADREKFIKDGKVKIIDFYEELYEEVLNGRR